MSRQARKGTEPELIVRRALHARGLRYRVQFPVPGRPRRTIDIAFVRQRVAVFVDGCFWHRCPEHSTSPRANGPWWAAKLAKNEVRDRDTNGALAENGWLVLRFWEHESTDLVLAQIESALRDET